jgi:hypothetical protein
MPHFFREPTLGLQSYSNCIETSSTLHDYLSQSGRYAYAYGIRGGFPHALRPLCGTSPIEFQISRHQPAPPSTEQWYLLASPFLPEAAGTKPPHLLEELDAMFGREIADNFAQRPP